MYCLCLVYSQTVAFGLPSNFSWIRKYTEGQATGTASNPFAIDTFDPFAASDKLNGWLRFIVSSFYLSNRITPSTVLVCCLSFM